MSWTPIRSTADCWATAIALAVVLGLYLMLEFG